MCAALRSRVSVWLFNEIGARALAMRVAQLIDFRVRIDNAMEYPHEKHRCRDGGQREPEVLGVIPGNMLHMGM